MLSVFCFVADSATSAFAIVVVVVVVVIIVVVVVIGVGEIVVVEVVVAVVVLGGIVVIVSPAEFSWSLAAMFSGIADNLFTSTIIKSAFLGSFIHTLLTGEKTRRIATATAAMIYTAFLFMLGQFQ
jgi:hypothetical protein